MKAVIAMALAATGAQATFNWVKAPAFECPKNTPEKICPPGTDPIFEFGNIRSGKLEDFNGMKWQGFEYVNNLKRDRLGRRTGGSHVVAQCGKKNKDDKEDQKPSFGCGENCGNDKGFDVDKIHVKPEFDCDLEFHYEMPPKKPGEKAPICKTRQKCSKNGQWVENKQCAGARKCTIVYPPKQPQKPEGCKVTVSKIQFSCKPTPGPSTTPGKPTTPPAATTTTANPVPTTTKDTTTPAVPTSSSSAPCATCKASSSTTSPSAAGTTSSPPAPPAGTTTPTTTPGAPPTSSLTTSAAGPSSFGNNTTPGVPPTTPGAPPTTGVPPTTSGVPPTTSEGVPTSGVATTTSKGPEGPKESLPCPDIVPRCLNTFLFNVTIEGGAGGCKDNTDHGCFCRNKLFVQNVYSCMYAHGETDTVISEAIIYFEGLCAPYCGANPEIVGPSITSYITPTATPTIPSVTYTTVVVTKTEVVPCTDKDGKPTTIDGKTETTNTIPVTATVPQVGLTSVPSQTEVALVPVAQVTTAAPIGTPAPSVPAKPSGSQGLPAPSPKPTGPVVAGSGRATASLGLAGFVAVAAAFML